MKARRAAGSRLILPFPSRSQEVQRTNVERAWPPTERALRVVPLERATFLEPYVRLSRAAAGPMTIAAISKASSKSCVHHNYRRDRRWALGRTIQIQKVVAEKCFNGPLCPPGLK